MHYYRLGSFKSNIFSETIRLIKNDYYNPYKALKRDFDRKILSEPVIVYMTIISTIFAFTGVVQMILAIISLIYQ
jgi:hypothetical protein